MTILPPDQHPSGSSTRYTKGKSAGKVVDLKVKEPVRPHFKASLEDAQWVTRQSAPVQQLWIECQIAEHFGANDWREVKTSLTDRTFRRAKTALEKQGLFEFKRIPGNSPKGRATIAGWLVHNNHGYYNKGYWEITSDSTDQEDTSNPIDQEVTLDSTDQHRSTQTNVGLYRPILDSTNQSWTVQTEVEPETLAMTEPVSSQLRINHFSTTYQQPTKVVGRVVGIPQETETPLRDAPTNGGMLEKEKEVSTNSPASVKDQAEIASDEPTNLGVSECSGDNITTELFNDVGYTEFPFQVGSEITINWPNTEHDGKTGIIEKLYLEAKEVDVQLKGVLAIFCFSMARILGSSVAPSNAPRFNPEHAQNRKTRQSRLKCADMLGECPGAEFLTECWQDLLLRSQVKALIAKHPQWGIFVDSGEQLQSWFDS